MGERGGSRHGGPRPRRAPAGGGGVWGGRAADGGGGAPPRVHLRLSAAPRGPGGESRRPAAPEPEGRVREPGERPVPSGSNGGRGACERVDAALLPRRGRARCRPGVRGRWTTTCHAPVARPRPPEAATCGP